MKDSELVFDPIKSRIVGFSLEESPAIKEIAISDCQTKVTCVYNLENSEVETIYIKSISKAKLLQRVDIISNGQSPCFDASSKSLLFIKQDDNGRPFQVKRHAIGDAAFNDKIVFEEKDEKFYLHLFNSKCKGFTVLHSNCKSGNQIYLMGRSAQWESLHSSPAPSEPDSASFVQICSIDDRILSVQSNSKGLFVIHEFETESAEKSFRVLFVGHENLKKGLSKALLRPEYSNRKLFFNLFEFQEVAVLHPEFNITEMDVFDSGLVLYCSRASQIKIIKINLSDDLTRSGNEFASVSFEEIRFRDDPIGSLQPATNSSLNPDKLLFYFQDFFVYNQLFEYDFQTAEIRKIEDFDYVGPKLDADKFAVKQVNYPTRDGALVPLTLVFPKKLNLGFQNHSKRYKIDDILIRSSRDFPTFFKTKLNLWETDLDPIEYVDLDEKGQDFNLARISNAPQKVVVKSYGVYGVSSDVVFNFADWSYLENEYIIAYPHIRGGSDLGPRWHQAALKENKHLSVLDLVDCFQYLTGSAVLLDNPKEAGSRARRCSAPSRTRPERGS